MLNKEAFVKLHSEVNGVSVKEAEAHVVGFLKTSEEAIKQGGFHLIGYLKAQVQKVAARSGTITKQDGTTSNWSKPEGTKLKVTPGAKLKGAAE